MRVAHSEVTGEASNGGRLLCCTLALWGPWYRGPKQRNSVTVPQYGSGYCLQPRLKRGVVVVVVVVVVGEWEWEWERERGQEEEVKESAAGRC